MTFSEAEKFKPAIERKLSAERINYESRDACIKALSKCVMGNMMVKAYELIYWNNYAAT